MQGEGEGEGERAEEGWETGAWGREEWEKEEGQGWEAKEMAEEVTPFSSDLTQPADD